MYRLYYNLSWEKTARMFKINVRLIRFFSIFLLVLLFFFGIGNQQGFSDSSLRFISITGVVTAFLSIFFVFYGIILMVIDLVKRKKFRNLFYLFLYFFCIAEALVALTFFDVLIFINQF